MMKISALLERLEYTCLQGSLEKEILQVEYDSRKTGEGALFVCIRGAAADGHKFAAQAAEKGRQLWWWKSR